MAKNPYRLMDDEDDEVHFPPGPFIEAAQALLHSMDKASPKLLSRAGGFFAGVRERVASLLDKVQSGGYTTYQYDQQLARISDGVQKWLVNDKPVTPAPAAPAASVQPVSPPKLFLPENDFGL